jgi:hypothetical protein
MIDQKDWRTNISRTAEQFPRLAQLFLGTKRYQSRIESDGLGVWVGIELDRAREAFELLRHSIFKGFEPHWFQTEDGLLWARFGYIDWSTRQIVAGERVRATR